MLSNSQVIVLIQNKDKVIESYDKELEAYSRRTRQLYPESDLMVQEIANIAFTSVLEEEVNASLDEINNLFTIIDRNQYGDK